MSNALSKEKLEQAFDVLQSNGLTSHARVIMPASIYAEILRENGEDPGALKILDGELVEIQDGDWRLLILEGDDE